MNFTERLNRKGDKITFCYDNGRSKGQRTTTGIFVYTKPKNQVEKNHNKEARLLLEHKKSQYIIEQQAIGSSYIPVHKFKANFLEYYTEYVELNKRKGNRHLKNSLTQFRLFIGGDFISPGEITENFCKRFRQFLLDKFTGETPADYFARYKWVIDAATSDGYFQKNPVEDVAAKQNPSTSTKDNLEVDEYLRLLNTPCLNAQIKAAFLFCCYTGLRWVDVQKMNWADIKENALTTRMVQAKTKHPVILTLHPIAKGILERQRATTPQCVKSDRPVFLLPTADGANKLLGKWVTSSGIKKHITWSCARLSFSILLQDKNVDDATVAYLMGHRTTEQVRSTYKRHRPKNQIETISHLPTPDRMPSFLEIGK